MPRTVLSLARLGLPLLLLAPLPAHGGAYRGPPGAQPPPPTPRPVIVRKQPGTLTGPRAGGGRLPTPTTPSTAKRIARPYDNAWFVWWEYNKAPYVARTRLSAEEAKVSGQAQRPGQRASLGRDYVTDKLVPLFQRILKKGSGNRELITGSLIALARLHPGDEAIPIIVRYLNANQEYSETAALALGISGAKTALPYLLALSQDRREAAKWLRTARVRYRTRAFALYGLGIWCQQAGDGLARARILPSIIRILNKEARHSRKPLRQDIEVAALHALRLAVSGSRGASGDMLRKDALEYLLAYLGDKKSKDPILRAHALTALGSALGRNEDPTHQVQKTLRRVLDDPKSHRLQQQSAILAIGLIGRPEDTDLVDYLAQAQHLRIGGWMAIALGRIGSDRARKLLLVKHQLHRSEWTALGLAILDRERRRRAGTTEVDKTIGEALLPPGGSALKANERDSGQAIALGIQGYLPGSLPIAAGIDFKELGFYNAYLAESLGLLGEEDSRALLQKLIRKSVRHPIVLTKAALALGQFGDSSLGPMLTKSFRKSRYTIEQASYAMALGRIGREAEADQLIKIVKSTRRADLVRGFAAVALGIAGEPTKLPWHYALSSGINYLARTETLVGDGKGILEIF